MRNDPDLMIATLSWLFAFGLIVANTDLLVIVPERVAEILSRENRVKVVACPIALPSYQVKQHWHERYVGDPANMWLRSTISRLFSG